MLLGGSARHRVGEETGDNCSTLGTEFSHCDTSGVLVNFLCFFSARL